MLFSDNCHFVGAHSLINLMKCGLTAYIHINTASVFLCQIDTASLLENVEREFIKMVLLAKLQPLLGIFEFCAFILRHQSAIDAKVVGLVFDNNTAQLANHISITLSGCEQKCFNTD